MFEIQSSEMLFPTFNTFHTTLGHRVDTYRAVTDICKHCGSLRFHVPSHFVSGDRAKNDQLRVFSKFRRQLKQVIIQSDACI
jgi:hypothetical protein